MAAPKAARAFTPFVCQLCRQHLQPQAFRAFTTTSRRPAEASTTPYRPPPANRSKYANSAAPNFKALDTDSTTAWSEYDSQVSSKDEQPHRLHVYATKHNTHLTLVQPAKSAAETASSRVSSTSASSTEQKKLVDTLLSLSAGNIGFRKAGRGSYDAAYQLTAFMLTQMRERGMTRDIKSLEVVLRGFGAGREAVPKVLLGVEGRNIRSTIKSVKDATRLKQGGPRSPKPRRLG